MIDERALEAAIRRVAKTDQIWPDPRAAKRLIEEYEAALWRPIEEEKAPLDGRRCVILEPGVDTVVTQSGAFRTITPPPQNLSSDHDQPKEKTDA